MDNTMLQVFNNNKNSAIKSNLVCAYFAEKRYAQQKRMVDDNSNHAFA